MSDQQLLDNIHALLKEILAEFDRVCTKLDIPYAVYGGTAIGAVRHQGFIPWDDDVDVLMRRSDYERFLSLAPQVIDERFALHNTRTVVNFPFMFTKMVLKDTLLIPDFAVDSDYRMPFFIDVLPVDNIPADPVAFKRMSRASWLWGRLLFLHGTAKPFLPGISGTKKQLIYTATTGANWALKAAKLSPQTLQRRWEKAVRAWEHTPTTRMADFTMRDPENWIITNSELLPTVRVPFEDITVQLPAQYDAWLRRGYGDYMQLPPPEARIGHIPRIVDFGPYTDLLPYPQVTGIGLEDSPGAATSPAANGQGRRKAGVDVGTGAAASSAIDPDEGLDLASLRQVQLATTYVLGELDRVCNQLGLNYAAYGGTAIGAVRHQGFIPWDDDADVCMARADYEKLLAQAPALLGEDFELLSHHSHTNYPGTVAVLGLKGTKFISQAAAGRDFEMPIGVDIFPLDARPANQRAFKAQCARTWVWSRALYLRGSATASTGLSGGVDKAVQLAMRTVHAGLKTAHLSQAKLIKHWERAARSYEKQAGDKTWLADFSTRNPQQWSLPAAELKNTVELPFEHLTIKLPANYDTWLKRGFGDYMTPPPPQQRVGHRPYRLEFGGWHFNEDGSHSRDPQ